MISKIIFYLVTTDGNEHYGCIYINLLTGIVQIFKSDNKDLRDYLEFVTIKKYSNRTVFDNA